MELDEPRRATLDRLVKIHPKLHDDAWNSTAFHTNYLQPYRIRNIKHLERYELSKQTMFCRQCLTTHPTKGYLLAHQLWIETVDNPLENTQGDWLSLQCQNETCDFDLITPAPKYDAGQASLQTEQMAELMKRYYNSYQQSYSTRLSTAAQAGVGALSSAFTLGSGTDSNYLGRIKKW